MLLDVQHRKARSAGSFPDCSTPGALTDDNCPADGQ
jgi:hypothetical protein